MKPKDPTLVEISAKLSAIVKAHKAFQARKPGSTDIIGAMAQRIEERRIREERERAEALIREALG